MPTTKRKRAPMRAGRGAAKGATFERLMAKRFSLWVSAGATSDLLWRSAGSGGRSTMRRKQTGRGIEYHASDIAPLHPDAAPFVDVFTLECKHYRTARLHQVLVSTGTSIVAKWWQQARRDAASVRRVPLLVVKENNTAALFVMPCFNDTHSGEMQMMAKRAGVSSWAFVGGLWALVAPLEEFITAVPFSLFQEHYRAHTPSSRRVTLL